MCAEAEPQERDTVKSVGLAAAMTAAAVLGHQGGRRGGAEVGEAAAVSGFVSRAWKSCW
jgi:hypothetical protein